MRNTLYYKVEEWFLGICGKKNEGLYLMNIWVPAWDDGKFLKMDNNDVCIMMWMCVLH